MRGGRGLASRDITSVVSELRQLVGGAEPTFEKLCVFR